MKWRNLRKLVEVRTYFLSKPGGSEAYQTRLMECSERGLDFETTDNPNWELDGLVVVRIWERWQEAVDDKS